MEPVDRRRFLKSAGVVAGTAAVVGAPGLARAATEGGAEVVDSPGAVEKEPVVVYVRDAARGEVTVMHGDEGDDVPRPRARQATAQGGARHPPRTGRREVDVVPSRSARDQQGPGRRQHGRVRVRQSGQRPTRSRSSPTTSRSRTRRAARTSSSSATTSCTRSTSTTTATRSPTSPTSSSSRPSCATRTRSSTTRGRSARSTTRTGTSASSTTSRASTARDQAAATLIGRPSAVAAVQHRAALDAELRGARAGGGAHAADRRDGLRRPAERRLLRRPRRDLRPRRPAAVPEPAPDPVRGGGQRRPARDAERAHDRDPDPDQQPDQGRNEADRRDELEVGARHLGGASRRPCQIIDGFDANGHRSIGPWAQVSRLGNPLFNEVVVPLGKKDQWNATPPSADAEFAQYVKQPELVEAAAGALPGRLPAPRGV